MIDESITKGAQFVDQEINARHCPFCGAEHWILMTDVGAFTGGSPVAGTVTESRAEAGTEPPLTHHPAISYYCRQCGFVRTHILPDSH